MARKKPVFSKFEVAEHLKTDRDIVAYLNACAEEGDPALLAAALGDVARARNMSQLARDTGMTREGLYQALSKGGNPTISTVMKVSKALGFEMRFKAV